MRILRIFETNVRKVENAFVWVGMVAFAILLVLDTFDVVGRYVFGTPIKGTLEISQLLMAGMTVLTMAYVQKRDMHPRVNMFFIRYRPRLKAIIELIILIISLTVFALIAYKATSLALNNWQKNKYIDIIYIPSAPFEILVTVGAVLLCLEFVVQMIQLIPVLTKGSIQEK